MYTPMLASVLLLACTGEGGTDDTDPSTASWEVVMHDLDATLLSVYAPSSDDVWDVGITPEGEVWAAGGLFNTFPLRQGDLIRGRLADP